jgi:hypothetical protein
MKLRLLIAEEVERIGLLKSNPAEQPIENTPIPEAPKYEKADNPTTIIRVGNENDGGKTKPIITYCLFDEEDGEITNQAAGISSEDNQILLKRKETKPQNPHGFKPVMNFSLFDVDEATA